MQAAKIGSQRSIRFAAGDAAHKMFFRRGAMAGLRDFHSLIPGQKPCGFHSKLSYRNDPRLSVVDPCCSGDRRVASYGSKQGGARNSSPLASLISVVSDYST